MPTRKAEPEPKKRVTTGLVLHPRVLAVLQAVAARRGSTGTTEKTEAGVGRPYSVSALIRELLDRHAPELEAELRKAGIKVPQ